MQDAVIVAQLEALRMQVGAFQVQIDALAALIQDYQPMAQAAKEPCLHLNTQDAGSTLTQKRKKCLDCVAIVES